MLVAVTHAAHTRLVAGAVVPAVGTWTIDPAHAYVGFSARRLGVATVRAWFRSVSGHVHVAENPKDSSVELVVATASIESGSADRDERLRSAEHIDVARHPTAVFRSTRISWDGHRAQVAGRLTLAGVTNAVEIEVIHRGTIVDPWGSARAVFSALGTVDREDWGLAWNVTLDGGGLLVSREVRIEVDVETVRLPEGGAGGRPVQP